MWQSQTEHLSHCLNDNQLAWLGRPYHLARALRRVCNELKVERIYQGPGDYLDDEAVVLDDSQTVGCTREVFLCGDGIQFCFARTCMPLKTYQAFKTELDSLNHQLLGDTLLYPRSTARQMFYYAALTHDHPYFQKSQVDDQLTLGARRSLFYLQDYYPLLVTEVFLPAIPLYSDIQ